MKDLIEKYVGKVGDIKLGGLTVMVMINDVKMSYGKERFLVSPASGKGEIWVEAVTLH